MRQSSKRLLFLALGSYFLATVLCGCAGVPVSTTKPKPISGIPGVYHRVIRGETLWRITNNYNVDLDEVVRINRISDATRIEVGQLIFIPNRKQPQQPPVKYSGEDFIWPIKGRVITAFGGSANNMVNKGINIQPSSHTEILASRSGKVIFCSDNLPGYGKTIIIEHNDGFSTVYARNASIYVKPGQSVSKGTPIAKAGAGGRNTNTYLHFEIRKNGIAKNPYYYLP